MAKIDVYSTSGTKLAPVTASDKVFKAKINQPLMAQAVKIFLSNRRAASARTKDRGDIKVTHAKVWRQKGTGRARHGSRNAPIFVGGAKAHGPSGQQNYFSSLSKKQKKASLNSALALKFKQNEVMVLSGAEKLEPKTKLFDQVITKLKLKKKNIMLLTDKNQPSVARGTKNLPYLNFDLAANLNTYAVLRSTMLIFTKEGIKCLE